MANLDQALPVSVAQPKAGFLKKFVSGLVGPAPDYQSEQDKQHPGRVPDWRRPAAAGYVIILLAFGGLGGWAATAPLNSSVNAAGEVVLESSRKTIQHFEGGMISKILVQEGKHVEQGQVLFMLDNTQATATANSVRDQLYALRAQEARLLAERDRSDHITFPADMQEKADVPLVKDVMSDETRQFTQRRTSLAGQVSILKSKIDQFGTQIKGLEDQKGATEQQLFFIKTELTDLTGLLEKMLVQKTRVLALERERARLEGVIGQTVADIAKAQNDIGEAHLQIAQLEKKFVEDVNSQVVQVREKIAELQQKLVVTQDVLQRVQIRAPRSGTIQNLKVTTVGGVIRPGEPLAELIPDNEDLIVNAEVSPSDSDAIEPDMKANVTFSAFHGYTLPIITGRVESVSRDRIVNEQSKQSYFLARVVVNKDEIPDQLRDRIRAGMPVEVSVPTGARTMLSYLVKPLRTRALSAFRER